MTGKKKRSFFFLHVSRPHVPYIHTSRSRVSCVFSLASRSRYACGWKTLCAQDKSCYIKIRTTIEHAARACWLHGAGYLSAKERTGTRPIGAHTAHTRGPLPFLARGHGPLSCPNTSKRKQGVVASHDMWRAVRPRSALVLLTSALRRVRDARRR